jgi:hypothetical protein
MNGVIRNRIASYLLTLIVFSMILFPSYSVKGNAANPSMEFLFNLPDNDISIVKGRLYNCADETCDMFFIINGSFSCTSDSCLAHLEYMEHEDYTYHKLVIEFTDGTRESNVFKVSAYYAKFNVTLEENTLVIIEEIPPLKMFDGLDFLVYLGIAFFNIPVEILIAFFYCRVFKINTTIISRIIIANFVSLAVIRFIVPMAFFYLSLTEVSDFASILIQEMVAMTIEAMIIIIPSRKYWISWRRAAILSIVMNLVSVLLGLLLISII